MCPRNFIKCVAAHKLFHNTNVESKISILLLNKFWSLSQSTALSLFFFVYVWACKSKSFNSAMQNVCETHLIYIFWNWRHRFNYSLWTHKLYSSDGRTHYIVHNGTIWTNEKCKGQKNSIFRWKSGWIPNVCDIICMQFHEFCVWFWVSNPIRAVHTLCITYARIFYKQNKIYILSILVCTLVY